MSIKTIIENIKSKGLLQAMGLLDQLYQKAIENEEKLAAAEAKCAALAAENAGLKAAAKETLAHWAAAEPGEMEQMMDKCMPSLRVSYCETPTTDAFLAEVRAQGVEMFSAICGEENSVFVAAKAYYRSLPDAADEFAAQLRQEAAQ